MTVVFIDQQKCSFSYNYCFCLQNQARKSPRKSPEREISILQLMNLPEFTSRLRLQYKSQGRSNS